MLYLEIYLNSSSTNYFCQDLPYKIAHNNRNILRLISLPLNFLILSLF